MATEMAVASNDPIKKVSKGVSVRSRRNPPPPPHSSFNSEDYIAEDKFDGKSEDSSGCTEGAVVTWNGSPKWTYDRKTPAADGNTEKYSCLKVEEYVAVLMRPYFNYDFTQWQMHGETALSLDVMNEELRPFTEWSFVAVGRDRGFYFSKAAGDLYHFVNNSWQRIVDNFYIEANTLLYADVVDEIICVNGKIKLKPTIHIIDGIVLGGKDIRNFSYFERIMWCSDFATFVSNVPNRSDMVVRAKLPRPLTSFSHFLSILRSERQRGPIKKILVNADVQGSSGVIPKYEPTGFLLLRTTNTENPANRFLTTINNRVLLEINNVTSYLNPKEIVSGPNGIEVDVAQLLNFLKGSGNDFGEY